jgi:hypothetical protein
MIVSRSLPLVEVSGRTIEGVAYRYVNPALVTDDGGDTYYWEQILRDADKKTIRDRAAMGNHFPLLIWHSQTSNKGHFPPDPIGEVEFFPEADHLGYRAVLDRSRYADEMLELVRDETARDVSVSYRPLDDIPGVKDGRPLVSRATIAIRELSICPTGTAQHDDAKILVMRGKNAERDILSNSSTISARIRLLGM